MYVLHRLPRIGPLPSLRCQVQNQNTYISRRRHTGIHSEVDHGSERSGGQLLVETMWMENEQITLCISRADNSDLHSHNHVHNKSVDQ